MSRAFRPAHAVLALAAALALGACSGKSSGGTPPPPPPPTCAATGASCASLPCCVQENVCAGGKCTVPAACAGTGSACTQDSDCCSGLAGACAGAVGSKVCTNPTACAGTGSTCTTEADCCNPADGCTGTPKRCTAPAVCAGSGSTCSPPSVPCCNGADSCTNSLCTPPAACAATGAQCTGTVPCCNGADSCVDPDLDGTTTCVPPATCGATSGACSPTVPCCSSSDSCTNGTCTPPPTCGSASAPCTGDGDCCVGLVCPAGAGTRTCQAPACSHLSGSCTLPTDCCAGESLGCAGNTCVSTATCDPAGTACLSSTTCCTNSCANGVCTQPANQCKPLAATCAAAQECCSGYCDGTTQQCASPTVTCGGQGATCLTGTDCCSAMCAVPAGGGAGTCTTAAFCKPEGGACTSPGECCSLACTGNLCGGGSCKQTGASCGAPSECCTGVCTGNACAALPGGNACKTLFDACTVGAGDCCSKNCVSNGGGAAGTCLPAYTCHAYNDVCFRDEECCSGVCDTTLSSPGRCKQMPGSCTQGGNPCTGGSNCCSRLCLDKGSGVAVCQPAAGCRMTGDYCDQSQACCGGSSDALHPANNPYGVFCDTTGRDPNPPRNDSSTKDDSRCTGGQACNPPGNICGGSGAVNASQNCCDGKKAVCKPDSNGIYRCFGGCPNDDCTQCPTGYDANNPACCIPAQDPSALTTASVCQFRDQCCGGAPCVPDPATGVLHCTAAPPSCLAAGTTCTGELDTSCCAPNSCQWDGVSAYKCAVDTTSCSPLGATCSTGDTCCSRQCFGGRCVSCVPTGATCAQDGQCCSGTCDPTSHACVTACVGAGGTCTADGDCCTGAVCNIPLGSTSGTCGGVQTCAGVGAACNDGMPCCGGTCYDMTDPLSWRDCVGLVSGCFCGE